MAWISVKDELPPKDTVVFAYGPGIGEYITEPNIALWMWDGFDWWSESGTEIAPFNGKVTHWTLLPTKP